MSARWVAGSVRAQALSRRRLGPVGARALAASASAGEAVRALAGSPYGARVRADHDLAAAQRGVAETLLWNLRVLAGWLPQRGAEALRALAGWFEIANVDEHLRTFDGRPADPPFHLGHLATAWPRIAAATSPAELRAALAVSPWRDPGGAEIRDIQLGMRLAWAERVVIRAPAAATWARAGAVLLVARAGSPGGGRLPAGAAGAAARLLGPAAVGAGSLPELAAAVPARLRWVLDGVDRPAGLCDAELRWWRRIGRDATTLLGRAGFGPDPAIGTAALLAEDARLVRAALEAAARGGDQEAFDAVT
ncbi:hypothetical protein ACN27G_09900 [Plantactinospora sp. WMMB334]|uniref:hypothetical protein n=1 Tax=Plantactinospora sp. WMMB334 TaxID=3404119 RepID=UPI003B929DC6